MNTRMLVDKKGLELANGALFLDDLETRRSPRKLGTAFLKTIILLSRYSARLIESFGYF